MLEKLHDHKKKIVEILECARNVPVPFGMMRQVARVSKSLVLKSKERDDVSRLQLQ